MTRLGGRTVNKKGRSTGRLKTNRHTQFNGQFAGRLVEMLESFAFRVLSLSARRVLDRLEIELGHHGGQDNGRLPCTYGDFHEYGMDCHSIAPAIRECVALGFVEVTQHGHGGNAEFRSPNYFRLTYKHSGSEPAIDEWRAIETREQAQCLARAARHSTTRQNPKRRFSMGEIRTETAGRPLPEKHNPDGGCSRFSMGGTPTENALLPMVETHTTVPVGETPTTSRSGDGAAPRQVDTFTSTPNPRDFVYPELPDYLKRNKRP